MKRLVLLFFIFISLLVTNCSNEEKSVTEIPEKKLVEAYVQISLIYESERGLAEKDARVEAYLDENNLSKQKIDRMLDKYKSNPNEWRGFFMKVQGRLRELEAQQRMKIAAAESVKVVQTEDEITIGANLPTIVDTVITKAIDTDTTETVVGEPGEKTDSLVKEMERPFASFNEVKSQISKPALTESDEIAEATTNLEEPKEIKTDEGLGFIYYKIKSGDNLSTLAKEHDSKTAELMMVNSLENANSIKIGQTLLIPNNSTMVLLHTISAGEALSKISSRYDSNLDLLIEINKIKNIHTIKAGDFLYVPVLKGETVNKE